MTAPSKSLPKKQGKSSGWNSNESDEPDVPLYPPWVMKVKTKLCTAIEIGIC